MTWCYIRKFHPVGEATGEGDTSAPCSILTMGCANSKVTKPAMTDTLGERTLTIPCLVPNKDAINKNTRSKVFFVSKIPAPAPGMFPKLLDPWQAFLEKGLRGEERVGAHV